MANKNELVIERIIKASVDKVWQAWTNPEIFKKWWGPTDYSCPDATLDVRVDGKYHASMQGPDGAKVWSGGIYKQIVPMEKIVMTDYFSNEDGDVLVPADYGMGADFPKESEVTITFESQGEESTKLVIRYAPVSDGAYKDMQDSGMAEGWSQSLDKLTQVLEG